MIYWRMGTFLLAAPLNVHAGNQAAQGKLVSLEVLSETEMDTERMDREAVVVNSQGLHSRRECA